MIINYDWAKHVKQEDAPEYYEVYIMVNSADTGENNDLSDIAEIGTDTLDALEITHKLVKGINVEDFDEGWTNSLARTITRRAIVQGYRGGSKESMIQAIARQYAIKKGILQKGIGTWTTKTTLKALGYGKTGVEAAAKVANIAMRPALVGLVGAATIVGLSGEIWNLTRWNEMSSAQKGLGVVGTGAVLAGGIAGLAGAIGTTNAWNPVGWVALGIGVITGITSLLIK